MKRRRAAVAGVAAGVEIVRSVRAICWLFALALLALPVMVASEESESKDSAALCSQAMEHATRRQDRTADRSQLPDIATLEANGAVIGDVVVVPLNIFDPDQPGENRRAFRVANHVHPTTRPEVVERLLLFEEGEPFVARRMEETARLLRQRGFLYDACVEPYRYENNRVDIVVATRDVWTLALGGTFERSGGANTIRVNVADSNFLGLGRYVSLQYSEDPDRTNYTMRYEDPALRGSRFQLRLKLQDQSDGYRRTFDLTRPFYALDTTWSAATRLVSDERVERIYSTGEIVNGFQHENNSFEIRGGLSKGFRGDRSYRWMFGYSWITDTFADEPELSDGSPVPEDRLLSYPWIGIQSVQNDYWLGNNMDRIGRNEDFNMGTEWFARLGYSTTPLGAYEDEAIIQAAGRSAWQIAGSQMLLVSGHASGRYGDEGTRNMLLGGSVRYYFRNFGQHQFYASLGADTSRELDPENQLLLGGDNGLRGYPLRFRDGEHRFLLSLEQRFYTNLELFKLVHVGAAVFFDAGQAWYSEEEDPELLRDVGAGLRLSSSRSARGAMIHLDVAFPLDGDAQKVQWLVSTRDTF